MNTKDSTILIADCHIHAHSDAEGIFFEMLDKIEASEPKRVVFLGDIFDLWIALDGYESFGHRQFIEWCTKNKQRFEIGFIEGNHEFFITEKYRNAFTWITDTEHMENHICLIHGDLVNREDWKYLLLRKILRTSFTHFLLKVFSRTLGPKIADRARSVLCSKGIKTEHSLPLPQLEDYSNNVKKEGIMKVYTGHFHKPHQITAQNGVQFEILPAWESQEEVAVLDQNEKAEYGPWKEILE